MANYLENQPLRLPQYVPKIDVDSYLNIGMHLQQQFDAGVNSVQSAIDKEAALPIENQTAKNYLQDKINSMTEKINQKVGSIDFRNTGEVRELTNMARGISNNPIVHRAVASGMQMRKDQENWEQYQDLYKQGKVKVSGLNNYSWMQDKMNKYRNSTDLSASYSSSYSTPYDVLEYLNTTLSKINPNIRVTVTPSGNIGVLNKETLKGIDPQLVQDTITQALQANPDAARQLRIDGWAKYLQGRDPQEVNTLLTNSIQEQQNSIVSQYDEKISFYQKGLNQLTDGDPKKEQYQAMINKLSQSKEKFQANSSELLTHMPTAEDKAYYLEMQNYKNLLPNVYSYSDQEQEQVKNLAAEYNLKVAELERKRQRDALKGGITPPTDLVNGSIFSGGVSQGIQNTVSPEDFAQQQKENFQDNIAQERAATVNYVGMYMNADPTRKAQFQEKWGDLIQLDNATGQYHIIPGKEKEFDQRQDDWAQQVSNAMRYPTISNNIPAPMRQAFNEAAKYQTITKVQKAIQDQINSKPAVQRAKNDVDERLKQFTNILNSDNVFKVEIHSAGMNSQDALDLQRIMSKDSITQQILTDFSKRLGNIGVVLKAGINGAWNLLTGDDQPTDMNFDAVRQKVINDLIPEIAQKTGVTNEKAIKYYINHWVLHKDSALLGAMNDFGPYTGELAKVGVVDALDNYYKAQGAQYKDMGMMNQSEWISTKFDKDIDRKQTFRQIMSNLNASYDNNQLSQLKSDGDLEEFLKVNPDDIYSLAYNPISSSRGEGTWQFAYKNDKGETDHITIKAPLSQIGSAIGFVPQSADPEERKLLYMMKNLGGNSGDSGYTIPLLTGRDNSGQAVKVSYTVESMGGQLSPIIHMTIGGKKVPPFPILENNEKFWTSDPELLIRTLHSKGWNPDRWEALYESTLNTQSDKSRQDAELGNG